MKTLLCLSMLAFMAVIFAGCSKSDEHPEIPYLDNNKVLDWHDSGTTIKVKKGTPIHLTLNQNYTTGYQWIVGPDMSLMFILRSTFTLNPSEPGMQGVGGKLNYIIATPKAGTGVFDLRYRRDHEETDTATPFRLNVIVTD